MSDLWESKPWWCQPWTIILTGIAIVVGSWLAFHSLWLTVPLTLLILAWWLYFLVLVPRYIQQQIEAIQGNNHNPSATNAPTPPD
jgi:hypothetical protein